jgi:N-acetylmuramic acid 6-phosphate etherase
VDAQVLLETGPELIPGSTRLKAGTATKLALNTLSTTALVLLGKVYQGQMVDLKPTNRKLRERALALVSLIGKVPRAKATRLLAMADGAPRLALALHYTGLPVAATRRLLRARGLASLASGHR